jgi:CheY-like chemotaxis protein
MIDEHMPDLVVLDYKMTDMDRQVDRSGRA